jgi:hypothetical protein
MVITWRRSGKFKIPPCSATTTLLALTVLIPAQDRHRLHLDGSELVGIPTREVFRVRQIVVRIQAIPISAKELQSLCSVFGDPIN